MMDRRSFFKLSVGGVAAAAAVRTWPFRVYSFPTDIVIARGLHRGTTDSVDDFIRIFTAAMRIPRKRGPFMPGFGDLDFGPTHVIHFVGGHWK